MIKRLNCVLVAIVTMLFIISSSIAVSAATASTLGIDVLFVVDASLSIKNNDPADNRLDAIQSFASLCTPGKTRIGAIFFNDKIYKQLDTVSIDNTDDLKKFNEEISGCNDVSGKTDIGLALKEAVARIKKDSGNTEGKCIVFLSDGKTVIGKNNPDRTLEQSNKDLNNAVADAKGAGIPIYTVGLNAGKSVDIDQLKQISDMTGAGETQIIDDASALHKKFSEIIAHHSGSKVEEVDSFVSTGDYNDVTVKIADNSVLFANVLIAHNKPLDDVKVYDEKGKETEINGEKAELLHNKNQSTLKLKSPEKGNWKISIKSAAETKVEVSLICLRDYSVKSEVFTSTEVKKDCTVKFNYSLYCGENDTDIDATFLSLVKGKVVVTDTENGTKQEVELKSEGNSFRGEYVLPDDHSYEAYCVIYSENSNIRSGVTDLTLGSDALKEPINPLIFIAAGVVGLILIIVIIAFIKNRITRLKLVSGKFAVSVSSRMVATRNNVPFDLASNCIGKYQQSMKMVLDALYGLEDSAKIIPANVSSKIKFHFDKMGNMCFKNVPGVAMSGGSSYKNETAVTSRGIVKMEYTDATTNIRTSISIQFIA